MKNMIKLLSAPILGVSSLFALSACDVDTEEGKMPEVDVKGGELPKVEITPPQIKTEKKVIEVPVIDPAEEDEQ